MAPCARRQGALACESERGVVCRQLTAAHGGSGAKMRRECRPSDQAAAPAHDPAAAFIHPITRV